MKIEQVGDDSSLELEEESLPDYVQPVEESARNSRALELINLKFKIGKPASTDEDNLADLGIYGTIGYRLSVDANVYLSEGREFTHITLNTDLDFSITVEAKADIVKKAFTGPVTPMVPASILQMHPNVIVVGDKAAMSKL